MSDTATELEPTVVPEADPAELRLLLDEHEARVRELGDKLSRLQNDKRRYTALVNRTDAGFVVFDAEDRVVWTNRVFREQFEDSEFKKKNRVGSSCHQTLCRKPVPCSGCPLAGLREKQKVVHHELNMLGSGRFRHVYATAAPVKNDKGKIDQSIVMLQDLSDLEILRRSAEAVRSTEERFRSVFEQAGAGMLTLRPDGSIVQVNPTFCLMLGYTESDLIRKNVIDVTRAGDTAAVKQWLDEVRSGKRRVVESEQRFVRRDGTVVWCYMTAVWQLDPKGNPTHGVALVQDISERKQAELALEQSRKRYEALVHSIDGIVWEADPRAFRFSFVSKQAKKILGYPVERWLRAPRFWRNHIHPEDLDRVVEALITAGEEKRGHETEYRMIASDGRHVWLRDTVSPVLDNGQVTKLRGLMVDVTERRVAEEALQESEEQLRQSQKMEAIGRLAGGIAHDFNNLLTAITGYGDFLLKKLEMDSPLRREAEEISKAALRAADLTSQLLAFSRQQVLQPKVLDLKTVVAEMETMLRRVIGEHIELITRLDTQHGAVMADPGQMNQVLLNLAVNARDAMPRGGKLVIATTDVEIDEAYATMHPGVSLGRHVLLAVRDSGCGMDDATMARLFEPFFTTKDQGKGTGLGLSTVYGIVKQSGGHILVESSPGSGATFKIFLPMVDERPAQAGHAQGTPELSPGTETVLLAEDDDSVRDLAREILEMNGYTVVEASNGKEALAIVDAGAVKFDVLVTDLVMPLLGGRELAQKVARRLPDLPVLYLSGYTDSAVLHQGDLAAGTFFLQKPFSPATLASKVRETLDS
jgi:two-component system cell cycle sensor histidine kinase/response regulator CckA